MTTGLTYSTFTTQIATLAVVDPANADFLTVLPMAITYAENRMYRDLDLNQTSVSITGYSLSAGSRLISVPAGTLVVTEQLNIITPVGTIDPNAGVRTPLLPVTKEFLDATFGDSTYRTAPKYFVPFDDNVFLVGPYPDQNYSVELVGTARPASLSGTNTTTFLSTYFPDLMVMAAMIYISGYQRNFGKQSDDPTMAVSYETQYQTLLKAAKEEEERKTFKGPGWTAESATPNASPTRG